jgi:hypothetical protein
MPAGQDPKTMDERLPQLERVENAGRNRRGFRLAVALVGAAITFALGLGIGTRLAIPATVSSPSVAPAFVAAEVSRDLWSAYLNRDGDGWSLCRIASPIVCRSVSMVASDHFTRFAALPLVVTEQDWAALAPARVTAGRYVLAGPAVEGGLRLIGADVTLGRVAADGTGTIVGGTAGTPLNSALWADLGSLDPGRRYVIMVGGYRVAGAVATWNGWAIGIVVAPSD